MNLLRKSSDVQDHALSTLDAAGSAVRELGHSAADSARQLSDTASRQARNVGDSARQWWEHNRDGARDAMHHARQEALALGESTQDYVRERPVKSMVVAVALGAAVTALVMLLSRRQD